MDRRYFLFSVAGGAAGLFLSSRAWAGAKKRQKPLPPLWPPQPKARTIVLTFDDGPRPRILHDILRLLDIHEIRAAFFVQGWQAEERPDFIKKLFDKGHIVGNHTWNHAPLRWYVERYGEIDGEARYLQDVERGAGVIETILGGSPKELFFRPPLWDMNERVLEALRKPIAPRRSHIVQLRDNDLRFRPKTGDRTLIIRVRETRDISTEDYTFHKLYRENPKEALGRLRKGVWTQIRVREREGVFTHVLTFHELPVSRAALEILIPEWQKAGYKFCTLRSVYGLEDCV